MKTPQPVMIEKNQPCPATLRREWQSASRKRSGHRLISGVRKACLAAGLAGNEHDLCCIINHLPDLGKVFRHKTACSCPPALRKMSRLLNKTFLTNLLAVMVIVSGYLSPVSPELLKAVGFFALSGAITNWLAIHMLFEKVPLLYGSGVIPDRFEEFKASIKNLMMRQFFTPDNIERFIEQEEQQGDRVLDLEPLLHAIDYERIYQGLVRAIMDSSLGTMLRMLGVDGEEALLSLQHSVTEKLQHTLAEMLESRRFQAALKHSLNARQLSLDIIDRIEAVIDKRLDELTPQMVKEIVQEVIREHLGWLVVWGGVFGGMLGAAFSFL